MITVVLALLAGCLSYANGANDVSKGIATLVGSGVADYRRAVVWGTLWTGIGAALASAAAGAMLTTFGQGILSAGLAPSLASTTAALAGAAAWVLLATVYRLPVSTTHALVGSVIGSGLAAYGAAGIAWPAIGTRVVTPLLVSPLAAFTLTQVVLRLTSPNVSVRANRLHWASSGAVCFSRGLNDAPKIVALALAASAIGPLAGPALSRGTFFSVVTLSIVAGSLLAGRGVTHVLATEVTAMTHRQGLAANLVTAALVAAGAVYGWPMSTTHVSSGGIAAVGASRGSLNWRTARDIGLAWVVTLPAAAGLGAAAYLVTGILL